MTGFDRWRRHARIRLREGAAPETLDWAAILDAAGPCGTSADADAGACAGDGNGDGDGGGADAGDPSLRISSAMIRLLRSISMYRADGRWDLMYRLVWRSLRENRRLLEDFADRDVSAAIAMERTVRREIHKMHAFVRFREVAPAEGPPGDEPSGDEPQVAAPSYFAWFEPEHDVLPAAAVFFTERFPNMRWTIATPQGAAVWESRQLRMIDGPMRDTATADGCEDLWRAYYRSICNKARLKPAAMRREMPERYWKHLPEAADIATLMRSGDRRLVERRADVPLRYEGIVMGKGIRASLHDGRPPADDIDTCRRCDLWRQATQAVPGAGPAAARIMLVGEQPGDEEDLRGAPFVGPAGKVLDQAMTAAGLERHTVFVTNAVKHFKWEPRGRRRLHKKPSVGEIDACHVWLDREIDTVKPAVIVALGATALKSLTGRTMAVAAARAQDLSHPSGAVLIATYHPSAVLRADERAEEIRDALVADLRRAAALSL